MFGPRLSKLARHRAGARRGGATLSRAAAPRPAPGC